MAGAPLGNTNSAVGKQGRQALEVALRHYEIGKEFKDVEVSSTIRTLVMMWWPILTKAMEHGDLAAMKEINDRLDGKAAQSITTEITIKETDPAKRKSRIRELLSKTSTS